LPEQIKNNPPVHVILPVYGTDVTIVLDHQAFGSLDEVRDVMKSLRNDGDAMNELIARLANASDVFFQYRDFQFIRKPND